MYIQRIPHPLLAHLHRDTHTESPLPADAVVDAFQTVPSASTPRKPNPVGYIVLAVVLTIALLSFAGFLTARRRIRRKANKHKQQTNLQPPAMKREGRGRFDRVPTLNLNLKKTGSGSDVSPALSSPNSSSEGPLTPSNEHELGHDPGDIGMSKYGKDASSFILVPIIVQQPHQQTNVTSSEITAPDPSLHVHFFDDLPMSGTDNALITPPHVASSIRPHGLPLSPVPEESSAVPTLPAIFFDEHPFYGAHHHHRQ